MRCPLLWKRKASVNLSLLQNKITVPPTTIGDLSCPLVCETQELTCLLKKNALFSSDLRTLPMHSGRKTKKL